ncbi:hypothetical protein RLPCCGM1_p1904 [Rhizobium leguminosarum bv. phaseoli CCGM1]|nr:hypothetical protein RLPCCGM1_p1904 [Rhizobium leguminosarum bv. phaseoli CCGM1]
MSAILLEFRVLSSSVFRHHTKQLRDKSAKQLRLHQWA